MEIYTIVALAYVVFAGQTPLEPIRFESLQVFNDLDQCQTFLKSEEYQAQRIVLAKQVLKKAMAIEKDTDAVPGVAITASCEVDTHI